MSLSDFLSFVLLQTKGYEFTVLMLLQLSVSLVIMRLGILGGMKVAKHFFNRYNLSDDNHLVVRRFIRTIINVLGFLLVIKTLGVKISSVLNYVLLDVGKYEFQISNIINVLFIIFISKAIVWVIYQVLEGYYEKNPDWDEGAKFAVGQILKYIIYTSAILSSIQALGFNLTVIWGGAAALLVGFGLGLQQTFTDLVSGIFMLVERGVNVGDILEVDNHVGRVKKIGFRASEVVTRDNIVLLIPNSKLVAETVVNWSHNDSSIRFMVEVGVAYGSDTETVKDILYQVAENHKHLLQSPKPLVRFISFGDSSLNFKLLFWINSDDFPLIEDVKSDLNYAIDKAFRLHDISIPFPQRDLWIRNPGDLSAK